ncbi:hypothetical protein F4778DRAFT_791086 [Xylariomycetidae sp. FL2044]|nr:hypothetical protein F4778DRAFT_791086 [Xylariomycetidae sp. FL2044]
MLSNVLLASTSLLAATATAGFVPASAASTKSCASQALSEDQIMTNLAFLDLERNSSRSDDQKRADRSLTVDTYFHVVATSNSVSDGYATQTMINDQLDFLQKAYNQWGIQFNLINTDWTVNAQWAQGQATSDMQRSLRQGTYKTLNLYFMTSIGQGSSTGYCQYPYYNPNEEGFYADGCLVQTSTGEGITRIAYPT